MRRAGDSLRAFLADDASAWHRDPVVVAAIVATTLATAYALFAGRYLPGIDYSNHLGLISVLAHGEENQSLDYLSRTLRPTPYLLYYALTAAVAQVTTVDVAARITLLLSAAGLGCAAASLADATGRSPRLAALAPLAMFGVSYGYGFVTFVFTTPLFLWTLARAERLLSAAPTARRRATAVFAVALALTFLGHGLLFFTAVLLIGARVVVETAVIAALDRGAARAWLRSIVHLVVAAVPAALLMLPSVLQHVAHPDLEAGTAPPTSLFGFEPWPSHAAQLGGHLLERGSPAHWHVMYAALAVFACALLGVLVHRRVTAVPRGSRAALALYAMGLLLLFLAGPMSVEWPSSVWYVYPRYGVIAAVVVALVPRTRLSGVYGLALVLAAVGVVGWNAKLNHDHIAEFSSWASRYDPVRAAIPPRTRVLALTVVPSGDFTQMHPALGSLYFYHLVDGASYTAFLLDKDAHPVHSRPGVTRPRAPFWRTPDAFDPNTHGVDFDYLVLRGAGLVNRTRAAGRHDLVAEIDGWSVFKTREPTPRPPR